MTRGNQTHERPWQWAVGILLIRVMTSLGVGNSQIFSLGTGDKASVEATQLISGLRKKIHISHAYYTFFR